jgi:uncharacterized protein with HEPN domain
MLDHAEETLSLMMGKYRRDLDSDRLLSLGIVRLMEIIGEAASRVPESYRSLHPEIPWEQVVALRNRLIHGYDEIDFDVVWEILRGDLPDLVSSLRRIVGPYPAV